MREAQVVEEGVTRPEAVSGVPVGGGEAVALGVAREEGEGAREPSALADSRTVEETSELPLLEGVGNK